MDKSATYVWADTEAADAFFEHADEWDMSPAEMRAIALLADDTDDAYAILQFVIDRRRLSEAR